MSFSKHILRLRLGREYVVEPRSCCGDALFSLCSRKQNLKNTSKSVFIVNHKSSALFHQKLTILDNYVVRYTAVSSRKFGCNFKTNVAVSQYHDEILLNWNLKITLEVYVNIRSQTLHGLDVILKCAC